MLYSHASFGDTLNTAPQQFATFKECKLTSGESITLCKIGYRTFGKLNAAKSNAILVPTWYGGTSAEGAYLASPELLNPHRYFVVVVDALANGVSSSPSNSTSQAGETFPKITISDMVISQHKLLTETLDIQSLHALVGLSLGGMHAFEWAVRYPNFSAKSVAAIASPRLQAFDIVTWNTRNRLLNLYNKCQCIEALEALAGVQLMASIPSALAQDLKRDDVLTYIQSRAKSNTTSISKTWDKQRQIEAILSHDITQKFSGNMQQTAAYTQSEFLIIVSQDDRTVTPAPALEFAKLVEAEVLELTQGCGHADPWCAPEKFATAIRTFIDN